MQTPPTKFIKVQSVELICFSVCNHLRIENFYFTSLLCLFSISLVGDFTRYLHVRIVFGLLFIAWPANIYYEETYR